MENPTSCPKCHTEVSPNDYFCSNCGTNLKPKPPTATLTNQVMLYLKSIFVPPFGILWALPFLKQDNKRAKIVGIVAIVLSLASLTYLIIFTKNLVTTVNQEVDKQLNSSFIY